MKLLRKNVGIFFGHVGIEASSSYLCTRSEKTVGLHVELRHIMRQLFTSVSNRKISGILNQCAYQTLPSDHRR